MCCGILSSLACCVGSSACSLCCKCCPTCKNSTSSRIVYGLFLLLGVILSCILLVPGVRHGLDKIPGLCSGVLNGTFDIINLNTKGIDKGFTNCDLLVGSRAVYSIGFGMVCFFAFMALLMICVKSSKDPRSAIQNGFWLFKIIAFIGPMVGAFWLPWDLMAEPWMVIGMIGAFVFILIQLVLIVDLAFSWNDKLLERAEDTEHRGWYILMLVLTVIFYAISLTGIGLMFYFYGKPMVGETDVSGCSHHKAFLGVNLALIIVVSVIAVLPRIQEANPRSGLLQPSIISMYVVYLTWSAITNDESCNPSLSQIYYQITQHNVTTTGTTGAGAWGQQIDGLSIVTLILWFIAILYATVRNSSHSAVGKLTLKQDEQVIIGDTDDAEKSDDEDDEKKVYDDEKGAVAYNYTFFHMMMMFASFYIMMTLTNWYKPETEKSGVVVLNTSVPAMWVKISSSWVCIVIYLWTLIAPVVLTGRDFS